MTLLVAVLVLFAASCSDDPGGQAAPTPAPGSFDDRTHDASGQPGPATTWEVTAEDLAFDLDELVVPVVTPITVRFRNLDEGVPHSLHVQLEGGTDVSTPTVEGPASETIRFTVTEPGRYRFRCDVHPLAMTGTVVAVPA